MFLISNAANLPGGCRDRTTSNRRRDRFGFSLTELVVVIVIIGMLASITAVQTRSYLAKSRRSAAKADIARLVDAVDSFFLETARYPTPDEGLAILTRAQGDFSYGFIKKLPLDPWGRPYVYERATAEFPFQIICLGSDGRPGGDGEGRDINSIDL
jgi:general secretion pathway protein G